MPQSSTSATGAGLPRHPVLLAVAVITGLAACEVPSIPKSPPAIDLRWVLPASTARIAVANILPAGVAILGDSSGFTVAAPASTVTRTLGQDCAACAAANGFVIAKPAFVGNASTPSSISADISSATLTAGTLQVAINNNYSFDPLRPSASAAAPRGFAVITVINNGNVIGRDSIDGSTTALPAGTTLNRNIALAGPITGTSIVNVTLTLNSPVGDPVLINAGGTLVVTATPSNLRVASANVLVANRTVNSVSTLDLANVDSTIIEQAEAGSLLLTIANPFAVSGSNITVRFAPGNMPVLNKTIAIVAGNSTATIVFTKAELRQLLGQNVTITLSGALTGTAGAVNVSPRQAVVVQTRLDVNLRVGG